jgi:hypothetical protein
MGTVKISALPAASTLSGTELFEVVQSATSKKATSAQILALAGGGTSKAAILAALGLTDIVVTDTTITISKLGADVVTRIIILPLE